MSEAETTEADTVQEKSRNDRQYGELAQSDEDVSKFLTFVLDKEEYGVGILTVREIIGFMEITPVPQTPDFVKGVINLRGQVIPVINLRQKFGLDEGEITDETCVIVVEAEVQGEDEKVQMGVIVDAVEEVLDIPHSSIGNAPDFGAEINTDYIQGMGKMEERVIILLDIDRVLNEEELVALQDVEESDDQPQSNDE